MAYRKLVVVLEYHVEDFEKSKREAIKAVKRRVMNTGLLGREIEGYDANGEPYDALEKDSVKGKQLGILAVEEIR